MTGQLRNYDSLSPVQGFLQALEDWLQPSEKLSCGDHQSGQAHSSLHCQRDAHYLGGHEFIDHDDLTNVDLWYIPTKDLFVARISDEIALRLTADCPYKELYAEARSRAMTKRLLPATSSHN
jgi:hypothetical protein